MQEPQHAHLVPGAVVTARGEQWHVRQARRLPRVALVSLEGLEDGNRVRRLRLLVPFDRVQPVAERAPILRGRPAVLQRVLQARRDMRPARGLWCLGRARLDVLPWQLAPALAVVDGATRILLADAVGLGKTVQAGLILAELWTRGLAHRALVLAPAAVRTQWAEELRARFDLPSHVLDTTALLELERAGPIGANPWSQVPVAISSIDLVKRPEVWSAVERMPLDVLIVDEAHHATPGTDRLAVVDRLARQVPWVVLASATPHSGDVGAYRALLEVGAIGRDDPPMRVFRRSHRAAGLHLPRRTHVLGVRPSPEEEALHMGVVAYARRLCEASGAVAQGSQLLACVMARRATSSPHAALITLQRRLAAISPIATAASVVPIRLPWEEVEADEEVDDRWLGAPGFPDPNEERACLEHLAALATAAMPVWSKGARVRRLVRRIREPALVFSEFQDTLDACRRSLEGLGPIAVLHGGIDAAERHRRLADFVRGHARVLLTTDVAGEGLNLQEPARVVITIEWPWSPRRLEQRIGRVHRLGQRRPVVAVHLTARGSYEDTVVARLLDRAARAADDLFDGADRDIEQQIASSVLAIRGGSSHAPATPHAAACQVTTPGTARAKTEADRVSRWKPPTSHRTRISAAPVWALPPRSGGGTSVVVVVEILEHVATGCLHASRLVPVHVRLRAVPDTRRAWAALSRRLAADDRVRRAAVDAPSEPEDPAQWAALRDRLAALRHRRGAGRPPRVQPSLFDRRAVREAELVNAVRVGWDAWQRQTEAGVSGGTAVRTTRVLAILPLPEAWS